MPTSRIEGLLTSFPKLIGKNDQHTFVETDSVRYVYQPLDQLYIVVITTKSSNILQDIDTLHLFSRIVSEYCHSSSPQEIKKQRFELILVFDEVISLGWRENINLGQIKTISAMESNDERIMAEVQRNKERDAKEEAKRRAQIIMDHKKAESKRGGRSSATDMGVNGFSSSSAPKSNNRFSGSSSGSGMGSFNQGPPIQTMPAQPVSMGGRGMQLGKKSLQSTLYDSIKNEEGVQELPPPSARSSTSNLDTNAHRSPAAQNQPQSISPVDRMNAINEGSVHLTVEEKITALINKDGGLENLEFTGTMLLKVNDPASARIIVALKAPTDSTLQFKTHPNVDKAAWANQMIIQLRDLSRPFPISQPLGVLKWRSASREESLLPLLVNCWPSPTGTGTCDITIEYELQNPRLSLKNLSIIIPIAGRVTKPGTSGTGTASVSDSQGTVVWNVPVVSAAEFSSGVLEFSMDSEDLAVLYPIQVHFATENITELEVLGVKLAEGNGKVEFSTAFLAETDNYQIS